MDKGSNIHVVFDLDDTLYSEKSYVVSAFNFLGNLIGSAFGKADGARGLLKLRELGDPNPVQTFWQNRELPSAAISDCIRAMRAHRPQISVREGVHDVLEQLSAHDIRWSILTDGRSITQRQKISALGLGEHASNIYISEERGVSKPDPGAFLRIQKDFSNAQDFVYVGDNPQKDFIAPNKLGWKTIMLVDDGCNIHKQDRDLQSSMLADFEIRKMAHLINILALK